MCRSINSQPKCSLLEWSIRGHFQEIWALLWHCAKRSYIYVLKHKCLSIRWRVEQRFSTVLSGKREHIKKTYSSLYYRKWINDTIFGTRTINQTHFIHLTRAILEKRQHQHTKKTLIRWSKATFYILQWIHSLTSITFSIFSHSFPLSLSLSFLSFPTLLYA